MQKLLILVAGISIRQNQDTITQAFAVEIRKEDIIPCERIMTKNSKNAQRNKEITK